MPLPVLGILLALAAYTVTAVVYVAVQHQPLQYIVHWSACYSRVFVLLQNFIALGIFWLILFGVVASFVFQYVSGEEQ